MDKWTDIIFYYDKGNNQRQQVPSAVVSYRRSLAIDSKRNNGAYDDLGRVWFEQKSYARASKFFQRASIRIPYIPEISYYWGLCLSKEKKYKQAAERFRIVIADPFRSIARASYELGKALFHQHLYHEALEVLEKDALKNPLDLKVNAQHQEALFYVGDFDKDLEAYTSTSKTWSEEPASDNIRGLLFLIKGRDEEAKKYFEKAANRNKEYTYAWVNWSMILLKQGKKREAMETLNKGIDFIEQGVNVKDEIEEITGHYKYLSDMLEKKALQASDEKEKTGLEKAAGSFKLVLEYLENPDLIKGILNEEVEKFEENKEETSEGEAHQLEENEFACLFNEDDENPCQSENNFEKIYSSAIEKKNVFGDMLNFKDSVSNEEADESEEGKRESSLNQRANEKEGNFDQEKESEEMRNDTSINKFDISKKNDKLMTSICFISSGIFLIITIFNFYQASKKDKSPD